MGLLCERWRSDPKGMACWLQHQGGYKKMSSEMYYVCFANAVAYAGWCAVWKCDLE